MPAAERGLPQAKARLRRDVRARRASLKVGERAWLACSLRDVVLAAPPVAAARTVACYASVGDEPGTGPLRAALAAAGVVVLLPLVTAVDGSSGPGRLDWARDDGRLVAGPLGTRQPPGPPLGPDALASADVVLVPALLVDTAGRRLGQGGGFYDVTLAALARRPPGSAPARSPHVVALVHDDELVDADLLAVPAADHDQRVGSVATPARWWDVPRPQW